MGKWPPIEYGERVVTTTSQTPRGEWTEDAWKSRKWGVRGLVIAHHDSHGLSYEVQHDDDGTVGHYDPSEIRVVSQKEPIELFICEMNRLFLRPDQPYIFRVDPNCSSCKAHMEHLA